MDHKLYKIMISSALVFALTVSNVLPALASNGNKYDKTNNYAVSEIARLKTVAAGEPELVDYETIETATSVIMSDLTISGQKVGTGAKVTPAVGLVNSPITVSGKISGAATADGSVTYLVSSSDNITAKDSNEVILEATALSSPVIIGNDTFTASYTVPVDASGNVEASFTASALSRSLFNVVIKTPFSNNGQPVLSPVGSMEWGVPGTLVLSPIYPASDPDCLDFSTPDALTRGWVPVSATILSADGSSAKLSGQPIKFRMTALSPLTASSNVNAFFTDDNGAPVVSAGRVGRGGGIASSLTYVANTDDNGQALAYINSNLSPDQSGTTDLEAIMAVSIQAQLVNQTQPIFTSDSIDTSYFQWKPSSQSDLVVLPTKVNAASDKVWTVRFQSGLDPTLTNQALSDYIYVTDLNGNPVNCTVEFGTDGQSVLVTPPVKGYNLSGTYYLYIKEGVKLQTGQPLQQVVRMGFVIKGVGPT
ncbi:MAG: hypothetical protein P4L49_08035 [Desulfosporosinus sp.]|nr:hypothetical protein [Desulfosporosinus sp.]